MDLEELIQKVALEVRNLTIALRGELPDSELFELLDGLFSEDMNKYVLSEDTLAGLIRGLVSIADCEDLEASALAEDTLTKYQESLKDSANPTVH